MKKIIATSFCYLIFGVTLQAQHVGINTVTPSSMAQLTVIGQGTYGGAPYYQACIVADSGFSANTSGIYACGGWRGVYGRNPGTAPGTEAVGVFGELASGTSYISSGYGVKAVTSGAASGSNNYGLYASATGPTGANIATTNWGIYGMGTTAGIYGTCTGIGKSLSVNYGGFSAGVVGQTPTSATGLSRPIGVLAHARTSSSSSPQTALLAISEINTNNNFGIESYASGAASSNYAIYATASGASTNYAGYFVGQIYATSASSAIKSFKIDHPLDPENKYLYHSSVESKDMMNIYNGIITTDNNGEATVLLPTYFDAVNKECKYQLTCIGDFAQAIVKEEEKNNSFKIKTDKPNIKVSWQITGVRHDPTALKYPIIDEVDKPASEKGFYLVPEAYGLSQKHNAAYIHSSANNKNEIIIKEPTKKVEPQLLINTEKRANEN